MLPFVLLISLNIGTLFAIPKATTFTINTNKPGPSILHEFLSVTIDAGLAGHWQEFDFNSNLVNTLAKGLSPLYFRYGGTSEDETVYDTNGNITSSLTYSLDENTLNMTEFSMLADFAQKNDWKFVFGLNAQERYTNNTWNPTNSRELMNKIIESGKDNLVIGYELGNEPDLYDRHASNGFYNVSAGQLAKDFVTLYNVINNDVYKNVDYKPFIWGCDIAYQFPYLQQFLSNSTTKTISGATWHHYYGDGAEWTLADFINIQHLDSLIPKINESLEIVSKYLSPESYDILGETSSTYGGGTANLSSSFVAGFLWLDKLGLSSGLGLHIVARQDFWGGSYGLIGRNDFIPNPDYWSSFIYKNLVGVKVLYVDGEFDNGRSIRTYSFCTRTKSQGSIFDYNIGDVTVMILNLQNNTIAVDLNMKGNNVDMVDIEYDQYLLTSYPNVIQSRDIFLNGNVLKMVNDETFPLLKPKTINGGYTINMEALSYGFVVIVNANATACLS